jgi:hypothetical protein
MRVFNDSHDEKLPNSMNIHPIISRRPDKKRGVGIEIGD